jgi:hypothetical protein
MFDLWLGFQRGFDTSIYFLKPHAKSFASLWVERSLYSSGQGPHLRHFLAMSQDAGLNIRTGLALQTEFLYGNHDNYRRHRLGAGIDAPFDQQHEDLVFKMFGAPAKLELPGLWAEHGHQSDSWNNDEDSSSGHAATQLAFFDPSARSYESRVAWALWKAGRGDLPRIERIKHAIRKCLLDHIGLGQPCRGIYVMGHTHEAMLKRVELMPWPPQKKAK